MSNSDFDIKWLKFVGRLRVVGVLLIFIIIPYLAFIMIPIYFIMTMVAMGDVINLNRELKDAYLDTFRSKYILASIIKLVGSITVHVGAAMLAVGQYFSYSFYFGFPGWFFPPSIIVFIVGFIIMIIGSAIEIGAWDNLKLFVYHKKEMFPVSIHSDTLTKVDNLRSGAVLWALGFLVVTIIIGWINQLIGYFGLSSVAERRTKVEPIAYQTQVYQAPPPPSPPTPPTPPTVPAQEPQPVTDIVFCPMCGAKVSKGALFCGECGVKLVI